MYTHKINIWYFLPSIKPLFQVICLFSRGRGGKLILADGYNVGGSCLLLPFLIICQEGMVKFKIGLSTLPNNENIDYCALECKQNNAHR